MSTGCRGAIYVKVVIRDAVNGDVIPISRLIIPEWKTVLTFTLIKLWAPRKQISWPAQHYFAWGVCIFQMMCPPCEISASVMQQHTVIVLTLLILFMFLSLRQASKYGITRLNTKTILDCVNDYRYWGNVQAEKRSRGVTVLTGITLGEG
jgi:hypothetical protein